MQATRVTQTVRTAARPMPRQLTFDLPVRPALGRGDFFVSDANAHALARLDAPDTWPLGKLALIGPEGSGKTHLAHVWAEETGGRVIAADTLASLDIAGTDTPVAVDDADRLHAEDEAALFHLHNHLNARRLPLLVVGRSAPARWTIALPDLKSRLDAADVARIDAPDDALLAAVLVKLFADRQLHVAPHLIDWLLPRIERSFSFARTLVVALDREALAEGRAVNRTIASRVLADL